MPIMINVDDKLLNHYRSLALLALIINFQQLKKCLLQ